MQNKNINQHMKWWGWGDPQKEFIIADKPALWPYILRTTGLAEDVSPILSIDLSQISLPTKIIIPEAIDALTNFLKPHQIKTDNYERLLHSYGKSFRDLWRIRHGILESSPDCVCYPETEDDIVNILKIATEFNIIVIPFGGGSNIVGSVEVLNKNNRMAITLDMRCMNKVLAVDKQSLTARIQAGAMGPMMEKQLNELGVTLGHFPDSFEFSTIGGWVATRSAGMKSDSYGKIEDMVLSMRMVTPNGTIVTKSVPKASNGIDINHICIGSEGILGVITEITVNVHPIPKTQEFYGYLFPSFEKGVAAIYECERSHNMPDVSRLNDPDKTQLSFAFKTKEPWFNNFIASLFKLYLKRIKKFDLSKACLMIVGFEGEKETVNTRRKVVNAIYRRFGGVYLGTKPGKSFEKGKYDFPYVRDFAMNYGIIADVSETSTTWNNVLPLYYKAREAILNAIHETGGFPMCGCHISHSYHSGASLYFTFGCLEKKDHELEQYQYIKNAAENAFIEYGGCLSHHHAVGYEHQSWITNDISSMGVAAIEALKNRLDPQNIMNPGKIIPTKWIKQDMPEKILLKSC